MQALTEFLPVSSSGHLALAEHLLGLGEIGLSFDVDVHVGTLGAVFVFLRNQLRALLAALGKAVADLRTGVPIATIYRDSADVRIAVLTVVATIPTGLIGLGLESRIESTLRGPAAVGGMLLVTAVVLLATTRVPRGNRTEADLTLRDALLVGVVQGFAVVPGISRAGSTSAIGLVAGLRPETAARFSFLLSIPAILGAMVLQLRDLGDISPEMARACLVGGIVSMVVGWGALIGLLRVVRAGKLHWFAPYLIVVGCTAVIGSLI